MHAAPEGAPPDIAAFLQPLAAADVRQLRMLASLCGLTYYMGTRVTPRSLARRHRLELVSTSLACERLLFVPEPSARDVADAGDGCCVSLPDARAIYADREDAGAAALAAEDANSNGGGNALVAAAPLSRALAGSSASMAVAVAAQQQQKQQQQQQQQQEQQQKQQQQPQGSDAGGSGGGGSSWSAADLVAAKLSEAAAAASAAALAPLAFAQAVTLGPLASAAGSLYAGGIGLVSSRLFAAASSGNGGNGGQQQQGQQQQQPREQQDAALQDRLASAAVAGIASAEVAASHPNSVDVKAASTTSGPACPSEWFVADDAAAGVRYFVVQGSDSLDHWRTNLMFEPVPFEPAALGGGGNGGSGGSGSGNSGAAGGIKAHRGAYEAALALYERFLPLVLEHVGSDARHRVAFTGHSIGGSMATLLALMFVARGALRPAQLAPTVTFGSPAIFCARARGSSCGGAGASSSGGGGGCGGGACSTCSAACASAGAAGASAGAATAGVLQRLGLPDAAVRNVIMARDIVPRAFACDYSLVADILRSWGPSWREHDCLNWRSRKQMFVHVGRAVVLQPDAALKFAQEPPLPLLPPGGGAYELAPPTLAARMRAAQARRAAARAGRPLAREAACVDEALAALMDNPHPLETLADPGAYLDAGLISRMHNPDNYCRALGRLLAVSRRAAAAGAGAGAAAAPAGLPAAAPAARGGPLHAVRPVPPPPPAPAPPAASLARRAAAAAAAQAAAAERADAGDANAPLLPERSSARRSKTAAR